jgi:2-keto-3-deoxy-L-rhamnonate aldolase RhmA
MQYTTRLHRRLQDSQVATGYLLGLNSPALAELLVANVQLDFVGIDLQHATSTPADLVHMLRSIQAADPQVTPLCRLPSHDAHWTQYALDAGCAGLVVPLVESADQARQLVRAAYFPPKGCRSIAQSVRASLYGDFVTQSNSQMILLPQIESAVGLERVEEIVAVDGITGVLVGPGDLSLDCGWNGQKSWEFQPFLSAVKRVISTCRRHGKISAILTDAAGSEPAAEAGFQLVGVGCDQAFVRTRMASEVQRTANAISGRPAGRVVLVGKDGASHTAEPATPHSMSLDGRVHWQDGSR